MRYEESYREQVGVEMIHPEFVPVVFARDLETAEGYRVLLERYNIPALIDDESGREHAYTALGRGVPVLVPDQMHDRASDVLASDGNDVAVWLGVEDEVGEVDEDEEFYEDDEDEVEDDEEEEDDDDEFDEGFDDLDDLDDDYEDADDDDMDSALDDED